MHVVVKTKKVKQCDECFLFFFFFFLTMCMFRQYCSDLQRYQSLDTDRDTLWVASASCIIKSSAAIFRITLIIKIRKLYKK